MNTPQKALKAQQLIIWFAKLNKEAKLPPDLHYDQRRISVSVGDWNAYGSQHIDGFYFEAADADVLLEALDLFVRVEKHAATVAEFSQRREAPK